PELRVRVPAALGVRALDGLAPDHALAASTFDARAAHRLARVFVATRAYDHAVDVLGRHHFVVLTGPPEVGKTAIATTIGLARLQVDAAVLDLDEKAAILLRHAKAAGLDATVRWRVREQAQEIVGHPHFTPERIRRFVERRLGGLAGASHRQIRTAIEEELGT